MHPAAEGSILEQLIQKRDASCSVNVATNCAGDIAKCHKDCLHTSNAARCTQCIVKNSVYACCPCFQAFVGADLALCSEWKSYLPSRA